MGLYAIWRGSLCFPVDLIRWSLVPLDTDLRVHVQQDIGCSHTMVQLCVRVTHDKTQERDSINAGCVVRVRGITYRFIYLMVFGDGFVGRALGGMAVLKKTPLTHPPTGAQVL